MAAAACKQLCQGLWASNDKGWMLARNSKVTLTDVMQLSSHFRLGRTVLLACSESFHGGFRIKCLNHSLGKAPSELLIARPGPSPTRGQSGALPVLDG